MCQVSLILMGDPPFPKQKWKRSGLENGVRGGMGMRNWEESRETEAGMQYINIYEQLAEQLTINLCENTPFDFFG